MRDELEEWRQEMAQPLQLDILLQTVRQHGARTKDGQAGSHTACLLLTRLRLALLRTGGLSKMRIDEHTNEKLPSRTDHRWMRPNPTAEIRAQARYLVITPNPTAEIRAQELTGHTRTLSLSLSLRLALSLALSLVLSLPLALTLT